MLNYQRVASTGSVAFCSRSPWLGWDFARQKLRQLWGVDRVKPGSDGALLWHCLGPCQARGLQKLWFNWNDLKNCGEGMETLFPFATKSIVIVRSSTVRRNGEKLVQEQLPQEIQVSWYCSRCRPVPRVSSSWHQHIRHMQQKLAFVSTLSLISCVDWIIVNTFVRQSREHAGYRTKQTMPLLQVEQN